MTKADFFFIFMLFVPLYFYFSLCIQLLFVRIQILYKGKVEKEIGKCEKKKQRINKKLNVGWVNENEIKGRKHSDESEH